MQKEIKLLESYLKLTDIMYQALKAKKYSIFQKVLEERKDIVSKSVEESITFNSLTLEEKAKFREQIRLADMKVEDAMRIYKEDLDKELASIHAQKSKLRKQSNVKGYYQKDSGNRGVFINKLK